MNADLMENQMGYDEPKSDMMNELLTPLIAPTPQREDLVTGIASRYTPNPADGQGFTPAVYPPMTPSSPGIHSPQSPQGPDMTPY